MKRDDEFPIEPLAEGAWKRIEQGVFAELDSAGAESLRPKRPRRRAVWALAAVPLAAAAAAVLVIWLRPAERGAVLESRRIVTRAHAQPAKLDDAELQVEPGSALVLLDDRRGGALVVIERGSARFAVPERKARPPFVVRAGDARVEVVGTRFRVERVGDGARVDTYEGAVRVWSSGQPTLVRRGERFEPQPRAPATPAPAPAPALVPAAPAPQPQAAAAAPGLRVEGHRQRFEQAALLERVDPQQALQIYRNLAAQRGPWAENALYAAGRLELERGRRASAERLLRRYLDRHPAGVNASDARALLQQLHR